jgi:hypothetical protein
MNLNAIVDFTKLMGALGIKEGSVETGITVDEDGGTRLKVSIHRSVAAIEMAEKHCPDDGKVHHPETERCREFTSWTWEMDGIEFSVFS